MIRVVPSHYIQDIQSHGIQIFNGGITLFILKLQYVTKVEKITIGIIFNGKCPISCPKKYVHVEGLVKNR